MTARARRTRRRSQGSPARKIALGFGVLFAVIVVGVAGVGIWALDVRASAPSLDELKPIDEGETSFVYAADGSQLGAIQSDALREKVDIDEIPKSLRRATIAIEDEKFYEHDGVDIEAVFRAALENAEAGEVRQGGSTITQQLVRNLYIADPEDTIERKLIEAKLANELEDERTKKWILEQYLNTASYGTNNGRTAVGVEAASQVYFNKHVSDLNTWEAALLAGLPQAPSEYNPFNSAKAAEARRNEVLGKMYEQGYLSLREERTALKADLGLERGYRYEAIREPYFFNYVEQDLIERYGVNTVRKGGLVSPRSTLNFSRWRNPRPSKTVRHGSAAPRRRSYRRTWRQETSSPWLPPETSPPASSTWPPQGHRQPGSSYKPFVLATAISQGIDPDSTYYSGSSPQTFSMGAYSEPWTVNNAGDTSGGGTISLRDATVGSVNVVFAGLNIDVGPENTAEMAADLGIESPRRIPGRGNRRTGDRRLPARHVQRVRDLRQRRSSPPRHGYRPRRVSQRRDR